MALEPYALSVSHFISSVGADAGFASIIGLAVLVLLYFAQARETASLREQAEAAAQRVAHLESRIAHAASVQSSQVGVAPAPGIQPRSGFAAAPRAQAPPAIPAVSPAPPAGVAAPPLSAATKLIPNPPGAGLAGAAAARIASSNRTAPAAPAPAAPGPAAPGPAGTGPAATPPLGAAPAGGRPATPPFAGRPASQPAMDRIVTPRPATAAGGATATNGTGEHAVLLPPPPPPVPPRRPVTIRPAGGGGGGPGARPGMLSDLDDGGHSPSDLTRVLTALAAVAVVAAIVIVLLSVTSGGTTARSNSTASTPVSNAPTTQHRTSAPKTPAVNPSSVTVAVLNGTAVYHLANSIATQLGASGFKEGTITNASTQTQPNTTVEYGPGYQRDAAAIARVLKLSSSSVQPLTTATQQTLGCPQTASCTVVVTVGQDLVPNAQTSTTG